MNLDGPKASGEATSITAYRCLVRIGTRGLVANKTFLSDAELVEARARLRPARPPAIKKDFQLHEPFTFSQWLGDVLHKRLSAHPRWFESRPVLLGSWARGELCPKSD